MYVIHTLNLFNSGTLNNVFIEILCDLWTRLLLCNAACILTRKLHLIPLGLLSSHIYCTDYPTQYIFVYLALVAEVILRRPSWVNPRWLRPTPRPSAKMLNRFHVLAYKVMSYLHARMIFDFHAGRAAGESLCLRCAISYSWTLLFTFCDSWPKTENDVIYLLTHMMSHAFLSSVGHERCFDECPHFSYKCGWINYLCRFFRFTTWDARFVNEWMNESLF